MRKKGKKISNLGFCVGEVLASNLPTNRLHRSCYYYIHDCYNRGYCILHYGFHHRVLRHPIDGNLLIQIVRRNVVRHGSVLVGDTKQHIFQAILELLVLLLSADPKDHEQYLNFYH